MGEEISITISSIVIPAASAILSVMATIYVFFKSNNKELARERLDKVLFPLMDKLEPVLYKLSVDEGFAFLMDESKLLLEQNKMLSGYKLYEEFLIFYNANIQNKKYKEDLYKSFSNQVITEYNAACRKIGLPRITATYRLRHKLYTPVQFLFTLIGYFLFTGFIIAFFVVIFLFGVAILLVLNGYTSII